MVLLFVASLIQQAWAWTCGSIVDVRLFHSGYRSFTALRYGFGANPPWGLGIGAAWYECFGNYGAPWQMQNIPLVSSWLRYVGCVLPHAGDDVSGNLPLTLYYVPFVKKSSKGMAQFVTYASLTANYWLAEPAYAYVSLGAGTEFISLEVGWLRTEWRAERYMKQQIQFRAGLHIGMGWVFR